MAISPDGSKTVALHNGLFTIIDNNTLKATVVGWDGETSNANSTQYVLDSFKHSIPSPLPNGSFLGVTFASSNSIVYLSGGDNGSVVEYDLDHLKKLDSISLNGTVDGVGCSDSFTSDLFLPSNKRILVDCPLKSHYFKIQQIF